MTKTTMLSLAGLCALTLTIGACDSAKDAKKAAPDGDKKAAKAGAKKGEAKPADAKPADAKPADAKPADAKPADAKPKVEKIDMKALKLSAEGWEGEYNEALESWTFEKYTPAGDGTNSPNRFYVDFMADDAPADLEAYAEKLQKEKDFQDMGYLYTAIDKKEAIDGGWVIVGTAKDMGDDEDKGEPSFVLYRAEKNIYCRGGTFVDAKLRDEALEACKTL